jgi:hypothetical protein
MDMGGSGPPSAAKEREMKKWVLALAALVVLAPGAASVLANGGGGGGGGNDDRVFLLGGTAQHAQDPENSTNDVIRISTLDPPLFGTVGRQLGVKIATLDNELEWKSYLVAPKTCVGGSPRMQLAIDLNGDGVSDGNAHGNFGPGPFGTGCVSNAWQYQDLTDQAPRWDVTQLTGVGEIPLPLPGNVNPFLVPWDLLETLVSSFPLHRVCTGQLTDDTFGIPGMSGIAYYDLISIGDATWNDRNDTLGRGFAKGCAGAVDDDDDHVKDDHDRDRDHDDDDDRYDKNRREHSGG